MSDALPGKFRPDIEGLRGIAIISVVLYHLGALPGGLAGVDVFFVLSGFLITGILLRDQAGHGGINLAGFWARRARRILPAATLVLLITVLLAPFLVSPLLLKHVGRDVVAASYFTLNRRSAERAIDYSAPGNDASPVIHFWSLSVEEQFYLVWPLLLTVLFYAARKLDLRPVALTGTAAGLLAFPSLIYCGLMTTDNQPLAFFGTIARIWELLAGAGLALAIEQRPMIGASIAATAGPLGVLALLAGFVLIPPDAHFPGWIAVVPVLGAGALIAAGSRENWGSRLVSIAPLTYAGRVSYAWYLWHWPVFFYGAVLFPAGGFAVHAGLAVVSFAAAVVTHSMWEDPVRYHPALIRSRTLSLAMGAVLMGLAFAAGSALERHALNATVTLSGGRTLLLEDVLDDRSSAYRSNCHVSQVDTRHALCSFGKPGARAEVVLFGDSHAAHFSDPLEAAAITRNTRFLMRSKSGCAAIDGPIWNRKFRRRYTECEQWKTAVLETIREARPKLVILSSSAMHSLMDEKQGRVVPETERPALYRAALARMIGKLVEAGAKVVLIKDTPRLPIEPLDCLHHNPGHEGACSWPLASVSTGDEYLPDLSAYGNRVEVVDLNDLICPSGICRAIADEKPVFYDPSHITASFAMKLQGTFEDILREAEI